MKVILKKWKLFYVSGRLSHLHMISSLVPLLVIHNLSFRLALNGRVFTAFSAPNYHRCLFAPLWPVALRGMPLE